MTSLIDASKMNIDSPIPTGPWTLYFHSPEETKWTLNTFISLGSMKTWNDFWAIIESIKPESLSDGMFFMMRDPSPPLWESHQNIRGGCYSFRCQKNGAQDIYLNHIICAMLDQLANNSDNRINGISISPKRGFNIIKLWNIDAQKFNHPSNINTSFSTIRESDIMYTPFIQKKM
jgi:hypothetical protein